MKYFLHVALLVVALFATAPNHNWTNPLKECANIALGNNPEHNVTKEELETITEFKCSYNGEVLNFEAIQDLINVEILDMRGNYFARFVKHYDVNTTYDENGTIDDNATYVMIKTSNTIPSWIGNLMALKKIRLSGNDLIGAVPSEIGNLYNLEVLDLSANKITSIPSSIGNLSSLKELHLSSNRIVQQLPPELGNLSSLTHLYLQDNRLHGEIPKELGDLLLLKKLRLNQNNLKGSIPIELTDLDLSQPNGLGLHENCNFKLDFPDCNASDENTTNCDTLADSEETLSWINSKSSFYRGYDGMRRTGGNCWTPAMIPIIMYLLSDSNTTDTNTTE